MSDAQTPLSERVAARQEICARFTLMKRVVAYARRNAIGLLALCIALGGSSYAAVKAIPGPGGKVYT